MSALLVGAAVTAMLLNLYGGVRRKMTQEFRAYGANVVLGPADGSWNSGAGTAVMDESVAACLAPFRERVSGLAYVPLLHVVARVKRVPADPRLPEFQNVVAVGTDFVALRDLNPGWRLQGRGGELGQVRVGALEPDECVIGSHIASRLHLGVGDNVELAGAGENLASSSTGAKRFGFLLCSRPAPPKMTRYSCRFGRSSVWPAWTARSPWWN